MLKDYLDGMFPEKQYKVDDDSYIFYTNGDVDTATTLDGKNIDNFKACYDRIQRFIQAEGYSRGYNLEEAVRTMKYDIQDLNNAIDNPLNPKCDAENLSKQEIVDLYNELVKMADKLKAELLKCCDSDVTI